MNQQKTFQISTQVAPTKNYASKNEVLEARKLAAKTLRDHGYLLGQNQAHTLNNFLCSKGKRKKGRKTLEQCIKVFNITNEVQQKLLKISTSKNESHFL
jgi:hypothetical protein